MPEKELLNLLLEMCDLVVEKNNVDLKKFEQLGERWYRSPSNIYMCVFILEKHYKNNFITLASLNILKKAVTKQRRPLPDAFVKDKFALLMNILKEISSSTERSPVMDPLIECIGCVAKGYWGALTLSYLDGALFQPMLELITSERIMDKILGLRFFGTILTDYSSCLNKMEFIDQNDLTFLNHFQESYLLRIFIVAMNNMELPQLDRSMVVLLLNNLCSIFNWNFKRCTQQQTYINPGAVDIEFSPPIAWADMVLSKTVVVIFFKCLLKYMQDAEIFYVCISCIGWLCFLGGPLSLFQSCIDSILFSVLSTFITLYSSFDYEIPHVCWGFSELLYKIVTSKLLEKTKLTLDLGSLVEIFVTVYRKIVLSRIKECHVASTYHSGEEASGDALVFADSVNNIMYALIHVRTRMEVLRSISQPLSPQNILHIKTIISGFCSLTVRSLLFSPVGFIPPNTFNKKHHRKSITIGNISKDISPHIDHFDIGDLSMVSSVEYDLAVATKKDLFEFFLNSYSSFFLTLKHYKDTADPDLLDTFVLSHYQLNRLIILISGLVLNTEGNELPQYSDSTNTAPLLTTADELDLSHVETSDDNYMEYLTVYFENRLNIVSSLLKTFSRSMNTDMNRFDGSDLANPNNIPYTLRLIACTLEYGFALLIIKFETHYTVCDEDQRQSLHCWLYFCKNLLESLGHVYSYSHNNGSISSEPNNLPTNTLSLLNQFFMRNNARHICLVNKYVTTMAYKLFLCGYELDTKTPTKPTSPTRHDTSYFLELFVESLKLSLLTNDAMFFSGQCIFDCINVIVPKGHHFQDEIMANLLEKLYECCIKLNFYDPLNSFIRQIYDWNTDFLKNYLQLQKSETIKLLHTLVSVNFNVVSAENDYYLFVNLTDYLTNSFFQQLGGIILHFFPYSLKSAFRLLKQYKRAFIRFSHHKLSAIATSPSLALKFNAHYFSFLDVLSQSLEKYYAIWRHENPDLYFHTIGVLLESVIKFTMYTSRKKDIDSTSLDDTCKLVSYGFKIILTNLQEMDSLILDFLSFLAFYSNTYPICFLNTKPENITIIFSCLQFGLKHFNDDVLIQTYYILMDIIDMMRSNMINNSINAVDDTVKHQIDQNLETTIPIIFERVWADSLVPELSSQIGPLMYRLLVVSRIIRTSFYTYINQALSNNQANHPPKNVIENIEFLFSLVSVDPASQGSSNDIRTFTNSLTTLAKYFACRVS